MPNQFSDFDEKFFTPLANVLEEQFPKGECKERSAALVLNAQANILAKNYFSQKLLEVLEGLKREDKVLPRDESWYNEGWNLRNQELNNTIEEIKKQL